MSTSVAVPNRSRTRNACAGLLVVLLLGLCVGLSRHALPVAHAAEVAVADSLIEFSGTQGQNNWEYGYYDRSSTAPFAFQRMTQFSNTCHPLNGSPIATSPAWCIGDPVGGLNPWTALYDIGGTPNGTNTLGGVQWAVRRWTSEVSGTLRIHVTLARTDTNPCGEGLIGRVIVNAAQPSAVELWKQTIQPGDATGVTADITASVNRGDTIDFAIDPIDSTDCDNTRFVATVYAAASTGSATISIQPASRSVAPNGSTTLDLQVSAPNSPVGAWTVDVTYDPAALQPTGCASPPPISSVCNTAFTPSKVRVTGASATGLTGNQPLASLTFKAVGSAGAVTTLAPGVVTLTDTLGAPMTATTATGQVTITADTTTAVTSSVNPSVFGQPVTFTATVTNGGPVTAGSVTFKEGSTVLAGPTALSGSGQATFTTSLLSVASHTITAEYGGSAGFNASSGSVPQQINRAGTTTALASSVNPSVFGQPVTLTATVSAAAPGAGTPTGNVEFRDGATALGSATITGGTATLTTSALAVGERMLAAVYAGDTNFTGSTSNSLTQTVNQAATSISVASSANPSTFGQQVTFTAIVAALAPGAGTPTGTVTFRDGSTTLGTGSLSGGSATYSTTSFTVGSHSITAAYGGDISFTGSTSTALPQTVDKASTTTSVASSANPSTFGQAVTFTATVSPNTATGTVQFQIDGVNAGAAASVSGGTATSGAVANLSVGTHTVTAMYSGDGSFTGSTGTLAGGQVVSNIQGDTNLDGQVDAVDALCGLRKVADLPPTTACPAVADSVFDVNGDTIIDSVDALCTLRIVAALPATVGCPALGFGTAATAARAGTTATATIASPTTPAARPKPAGTAQVSVQPGNVQVAPGQTTTVAVQAVTKNGLGAWTVDLTYDPAVVKVTGCAPAIASAVCNPSFKPNTIRIAGASAAALAETQAVASITFTAVGAAGSTTRLGVGVVTLADGAGAALKATTGDGLIRITK